MKDFSLSTWKEDHGLGPNENIEGLLSDQLFEHLELSQYLASQCTKDYFKSFMIATECSQDVPRWFEDNDDLFCGFQSSCSNISCCVMLKSLGRSFTVNVDIRPCEFQMFIAIEKLQKVVPLSGYNWGTADTISLSGIISMKYAIYDVSAENVFIIDLEISVCPDAISACLFDGIILNKQRIKKEQCNWEDTSIDADFNLTSWMYNRGLDLDAFSVHGTRYLMETLGIDTLLLQPSCNLQDRIYEEDVLDTDCSMAKPFSSLMPLAACRLSSECTHLECCLDTPYVNQHFKVEFDFDPCNYKYTIIIEQFRYENNLFNVDLATEHTFSLLGVVSLRYRIEDLDVERLYIVNLRITICLHRTVCPIDLQILHDTLIRKPNCFMKLKQEYEIKDFSLKRWLDISNASFPVSKNVASVLMSQLGITKYLETNVCVIGLEPFNQLGWNRDACPLNVSVPDQQLQDISCSLTTKCTSASCCIPIPLMERNIKVYIDVDPCALTMILGIERLQYFVSLIDYDFGREEYVWLSGVFRLKFTIYDITSKNEYLVSLTFEECWESNDVCSNEYSIFKNQRLPKQICNSVKGYTIPEFSFSSWMTDHGLSTNATLDVKQKNQLLADLGLSAYLKENECIIETLTTGLYQNGWISECPYTVQLPLLLDGIQCTLLDYCTSVSCCVALKQIGYNLQADLDIDTCNQILTIKIERLKKEIILIEYDYGALEEFWLYGIAHARYQVYDLREERKYLLNMNISICFESHLPCLNYTVFRNTKVKKVKCDWGMKADNTEAFSISNWMSNFKEDITNISNLPAYATDVLYNDMGVGDFLSESQCFVKIHPFSVKGGIKNECTGYSKPLNDLGPVSCHLSSTCMSLECCIDTEYLPRTLHTFLQINACKQTLLIGIEKFTFEMDLVNYDFGTTENFWLQKIFRTDFRLFDLKKEEVYVVDYNVSICLEDGAKCNIKQVILSHALLPKPQCALKEGFKQENFSFTGWMTENGYSLGDEISDLDYSKLMEDLGLPRYLKVSECNMSSITDNETSVCALRSHMVDFPHQLNCYLPTCNDIKCCLSVEPIRRNFMISFSVDPCKNMLSIEVEELKVQMSLSDFEWNKEQEVYLKGVIKVMFILDNLNGQNAFVLSLQVKACLEFNTICYFEKNIFNKVKISKRFCDYSASISSFPIEEFSLLEWKLQNNLPTDMPLSNPFSAILLEDLGLSMYLSETPCQMNHTEYSYGWKNSCPHIKTSHLPESVECSIDSTCSKLECCLSVIAVNRNIKFEYDIDVCESIVEVSIENLQMKHSLFHFPWGETKRLNFGGIVRLDFSFSDLPNEKKIMSSASFNVCFESSSPCILQTNILDKVIFPKESCKWNRGYIIDDFSLQQWISQEGLTQGIPLDEYYTAKLLETLNVAPFLMKDSCMVNVSSNTSWTSECPRSLTTGMHTLPNTMHCVIGQSCTEVECCIGLEILNRTFKTQVTIDSCAYQMTFAVENYKHSKQLFNYTWGKTEQMWLYGVVRISVSVYDLGGEGKYIVNMNISVCLEANAACQVNVQVLENAILPKLDCDWNVNFADADFDLDTWFLRHGLSSEEDLTQEYTLILYNDLNLSPFIGEEECMSGSNSTLNVSALGWTKECLYDIDLPQLPESTVCRVPTFCTGIECCSVVKLLRRNINTYIFVHSCLNRLEIGIERMKYTVDLSGFEFGTEKIVSLQGVFNLRFSIEDLKNEGVLLMTLDINICFSTKKPCTESISIFENAKLQKPVCDLNTGYKIKDFSMKEWLINNGLEAGNIEALPLSMLYEELGISTYLSEDICNIPEHVQNWEKECPLDVDVPVLPEHVYCRLETFCNAVDCCINSELLQRTFALTLKVDPCDMILTIAIEKLQFEISLFEYSWGSENMFDLFGVIRMRYSVDDLHIARMYLLNVEIAVCLESNGQCETVVSVFNHTLLNKRLCNLDPGFAIQNFSLAHWLTAKGYPFNSYLGDDVTTELLEVLGIIGYLNEIQCDRKSQPYSPSANGWKKST
ncbi:uncharacterized protein LOC128556671 [Mercenaria mercenaria]|uniref:uncharacterized protein LOC128556671 n=1 Tax=Mercenaria mercenaria TaxID=6596 RepID=UPI00234EC31C|nr:uncharacterized protein LOC128556671 [Mercenaria mercenaria]